jgi:hypothetical protein
MGLLQDDEDDLFYDAGRYHSALMQGLVRGWGRGVGGGTSCPMPWVRRAYAYVAPRLAPSHPLLFRLHNLSQGCPLSTRALRGRDAGCSRL